MGDNASEKLGEVYVLIKTKTDQLEKEMKDLNKKIDRQAVEMGSTFVNKLGSQLAKIGSYAAGIFSVGKAFQFLKSSIAESIEASKSLYKVNQAVNQTGYAAGYTAEELKRIAGNLENINAIDADKILNDVTLQLLTFGNVSGETFKRAQQAALDLSSVLGTDLKSSSIQLGKALSNPTEGLQALRRSGVLFTDQQEVMIKKLISQNRLFDAQKIILDEIHSKYGGQAQAQAEATKGLQAASIAWSNMKEEIGNLFGPLLSEWLPKAIYFVQDLTRRINELREGGRSRNAAAGIEMDFSSMTDKERADFIYQQQINSAVAMSKYNKATSDFRNKKLDYDAFKEIELTTEIQVATYEKLINLAQNFKRVTGSMPGGGPNGVAEIIANDYKDAVLTYYDIIEKYYEDVKFLDENYFNWKSEQLIRQGLAMQAAGLSEVETQQWVNVQLKRLMEEREQFFEDGFLPTISSDYGKEILDWVERIEEAFLDGVLKRTELQERLREDMMNTASQFGNELERAFGRAGDKFINYMNQALQAALRIMDILDKVGKGEKSTESGAIGIITSLIGLFAMHKGGSVTNIGGNLSFAPLPKAARGGSFIVPPGFPNDSALVRVESGETLHVTPAKQTSNYYHSNSDLVPLMQNLVRGVNKLNKNLINKRFEAMVFNPISPTGLVQDITSPAEERLRKEGVKF
ncbi:MAG TPA: phage tail length tape measure family protein [Melioribacteraceae bacterium]|nr:phage tail length tape measure family protein [Melioribacteraceae bacterium]